MASRLPPADRVDGHQLAELVDVPVPDYIMRADSFDNFDGFMNELTGIGDPTRDKTLGGSARGPSFIVKLMSGTECQDRWRGSDLGGRIIETIPDEMTREGWEVLVQPNEEEAKADGMRQLGLAYRARKDFAEAAKQAQQTGFPIMPKKAPGEIPEPDDAGAAIAEALEKKEEEVGAYDAFWKALCYERAYGGAGILLGVDDGEPDLSRPLNEKNIKSFSHMTPFRGGWDGELIAWDFYNGLRDPKYGQPKTYMLRNLGVPLFSLPTPSQPGAMVLANQLQSNGLIDFVHESRLLIFGGTPVSYQAGVQMRGWGDSIFTRIDEVLADFGMTWKAIAILMQEFAQGVLKIDGLARLLASKDPADQGIITARMLALNMAQSIARVRMLDKNEEFTREMASLAGVSDILQQFSLRLAAAADMPVDLLMGQTQAGGLNKGDQTVRFFYDRIRARQFRRLKPRVERMSKLMLLAKDGPTKGAVPKQWGVQFKPLYQMTELEMATLRKTQSETDHNYITDSVVSAEEIAASRFGGAKYSTETVIDFETRRKMAAQDKAQAEELAKNPPAPPQLPPGPPKPAPKPAPPEAG